MNRPLRIVHAGIYMYGGGAERWLASLAQALPSYGLQIDKSVILSHKHWSPEFARSMPFPVFRGDERTLAREARETDLLMFWGPVPVDRSLSHLRPAERPSVLFVAHHPAARPSLLAGARSTNHVLCVADHLRQSVCPDYPSSVIYPAADPAHLAADGDARDRIRMELGFGPGDFVAGFVGSFNDNKRPGALLGALQRLPAGFKGLFVGKGRFPSGNSSRWRTVSVTQNIGPYYRAMDAVCVMSREEGFSLVPLEAIYCGVPLLSVPHADMERFFVDRKSVLFLDEANLVESIVEQLTFLARNPLERSALIEAGRALSASWHDFGQIAGRFTEVAAQCLERKKRREHPAGPFPG